MSAQPEIAEPPPLAEELKAELLALRESGGWKGHGYDDFLTYCTEVRKLRFGQAKELAAAPAPLIVVPPPATITEQERTRLDELEAIVEKGLATYIEVGFALGEIREKFRNRFPSIGFENFEDYCQRKWKFGRQNAIDLINTAAVAKDVQSIVQIDRGTARALQAVEPEQRLEVVAAAVEIAKDEGESEPSKKHVKAAVEVVKHERHRPIEGSELSPEQKQELEQSAKDSKALFSLKREWRKAGKKDRQIFREWISNQ